MTNNRNSLQPRVERILNRNQEQIPYTITRQMSSHPFMPQSTYATEMISTPESTEAIIARYNPRKAVRLIDRIYKRRDYNEALAIGQTIVNNLIESMPEDERRDIKGVEIYPDKILKKGFLGIGTERGLVIRILKS